MLSKKSKENISIILIIVVVLTIFFLYTKNIWLLFYAQYQNGVRCQWVDDQHSVNSIWIDQEEKYVLSFVPESEFCVLTRKEDGRSIQCELCTHSVYFFKPDEEIIYQYEKRNVFASWLFDKEKQELLIEISTVEEDDFWIDYGIKEDTTLAFKQQGDN